MPPSVVILDRDVELAKVYAEILSHQFELRFYTNLKDFDRDLTSFSTNILLITELTFEDGDLSRPSNKVMNWLVSNPVLVVSSNNNLQLIYSTLKDWADDYMDKPFNNNTLLAKCIYLAGQKSLYHSDASKMIISRNNSYSDSLTAIEFRLMSLLMESVDHKVSIDSAIEFLWKDSAPYQRIHTLLSRIRPKIKSLDMKLEVSRDGKISIYSDTKGLT